MESEIEKRLASLNTSYSSLPETEKQMVIRFTSSLSEDIEFNIYITNFILTQLNNDSISRSVADEKLYIHLVKPSVSALFRLIMVGRLGTHSHIENYKTYIATKNFMKLLFTRVLFGRDRELEAEKIRASKPPAYPDAPKRFL